MHTVPAKAVGDDFLANHIGQLLFRQPAKQSAEKAKTSSSGGSTVCGVEITPRRRASRELGLKELVPIASSRIPRNAAGTGANAASPPPTSANSSSHAESRLRMSVANPVERSASLDHSSESSGSEPSSHGSRVSEPDHDVLLRLENLSLSHLVHRRTTSEAPLSPRVTFVTSFGARPKRSRNKPSPAESEPATYFTLDRRGSIRSNNSSYMSNASLSPIDHHGGLISWNTAFRNQQQSFAQALVDGHEIARQFSRTSSRDNDGEATGGAEDDVDKAVTPTYSEPNAGPTTHGPKSNSFSGAGASPARIRLTRTLTSPSDSPTIASERMPSPSISSCSSRNINMTRIESSSGSRSARGHARKASLVPKGDDGRTFRFLEPPSDIESDSGLIEDDDAMLPIDMGPSRSAIVLADRAAAVAAGSAPVSVSAPKGQDSDCSATHEARGSQETDSEQITKLAPTRPSSPSPDAIAEDSQALGGASDTAQRESASFYVVTPPPLTGSSVRLRKLTIQPRNKERQTLLERTIAEERRTQPATIEILGQKVEKRLGPDPLVPETVPVERKTAGRLFHNTYHPIGFGQEQRSFRRLSTIDAFGDGLASDIASGSHETGGDARHPTVDERTSTWAREQIKLASPPLVEECSPPSSSASSEVQQGSESSVSDDGRPANQSRPSGYLSAGISYHSNSHSSSMSSGRTNVLDMTSPRTPRSDDAETAVSSPELETPPEALAGQNERLKLQKEPRSFRLNSVNRTPSVVRD
ncbi:hypothetical protein BCV70DRAFT_5218 [Testicularia cyperi]|uniref:Uncharacterized protein n=1 Tax=Testicularia cyperi TaxID=1882483 RepID=A0A317XZG0_9BASI|nr:hypothetical protein BCV70DRAFT_5218 [Testicularia cyperi]